MATAQTAATIDEFSGGRLTLGLGVSHRLTVENWFGQTIDKPVREMREYAGIVRAILRGEDPPTSEKFTTSFRFMGYAARPDFPIYIAALSPAMLRLAGRIGDGVVLWLCNPDYIRDVVVPEVTTGRERAGKTLEGFDIVAAVPSAITDEPEQARDKLRKDLIPYFSLPFYRAMLERSGFEADIAGFDAGMEKGDVESRRRLDLGRLPGDADGDRRRGLRARVGAALPGRRRDVAVHRRRAADGFRRDARGARVAGAGRGARRRGAPLGRSWRFAAAPGLAG